MKVLQLCIRVPYPPTDGGTIAMYNILKSLWYQNVEVDVMAINTPKHFVDTNSINPKFIDKSNLETVNVDTNLKPIAAFSHLIKNQSYNISRFYCKKFESQLIKKLKQVSYDIVQLESLFMAPYISAIRQNSNSKIVLRAHNIEHMVWERLCANEKKPVTKWYLKKLSSQLKKYETSALQNIDAVVTISKDDLKYMKKCNSELQSIVFPSSVDIDDYPLQLSSSKVLSIFHLGSMDWFPNIEGVDWFLEKVYPKLHKKLPDLQISLAGKNMPLRILNKKLENVVIEGKIDNPVEYMKGKDIMIVPLFSGGGMRVKIIEGMALGKVIISTSLGAEGINCVNNENIILADTEDEFIDKISEIYSNIELYNMIGENARQLICEEYENETLGKKLHAFYKSLIPEQEAAPNTLI